MASYVFPISRKTLSTFATAPLEPRFFGQYRLKDAQAPLHVSITSVEAMDLNTDL